MELLLEMTHRFKGDYPDVPLAPDIESLTDDDGEKPFFVTLPIGEIDHKSGNKRFYDGEAVRALVKQINERRPGGGLGHLREEERDTKFSLPVLMWVGAILDDKGIAWGKAFVPKYAADVREYLKTSMRAKSRVATSIYGKAVFEQVMIDGEMYDRVVEPYIEKIDMADPDRAGVKTAVALPKVTQEQIEGDMGQTTTAQPYAELIADRDKLHKQLEETRAALSTAEAGQKTLIALQTLLGDDPLGAVKALQAGIAEIQKLAGTNDALPFVQGLQGRLAELEKLLGAGDLVEHIKSLQADKSRLEGNIAELLDRAIEAEVTTTVQVPLARGSVRALVTAERPKTLTEIKTKIGEVLDRDSVKTMLSELVIKTMGPPQPESQNGGEQPGTFQFVDIPKRED